MIGEICAFFNMLEDPTDRISGRLVTVHGGGISNMGEIMHVFKSVRFMEYAYCDSTQLTPCYSQDPCTVMAF